MNKHIHQKYVNCLGISSKGSPADKFVEELRAKTINYQKPPTFFGIIDYLLLHDLGNPQYTHSIHGTGIFVYVYHKNQPFM